MAKTGATRESLSSPVAQVLQAMQRRRCQGCTEPACLHYSTGKPRVHMRNCISSCSQEMDNGKYFNVQFSMSALQQKNNAGNFKKWRQMMLSVDCLHCSVFRACPPSQAPAPFTTILRINLHYKTAVHDPLHSSNFSGAGQAE